MSRSKIPILTSAEDIQDSKKQWLSTLSFRRFRKKHNELSRLNWTSQLGAHFISNENKAIEFDQKLTFTTTGIPFKPSALPLTKEEMNEWIPLYENAIRNSVLLMSSGNLELYLKRATRFYLVSVGHASKKDPFALTSVGEAIGRPVLKGSTIHIQLKYLQELLGIEFNKHLTVWEKAYKERCNLAHQAGVVTHLDKEDIKFYGENIATDWPSLLQLLDSTNQICAVIDQKIASAPLRLVELEFELSMLKAAKKLPSRDAVWTFVHSTLGCRQPSKADKSRIECALYDGVK